MIKIIHSNHLAQIFCNKIGNTVLMSAWVGEGNINLFNKIPKFRKLVNFDI
jgi:hypothetical protein